MSAKTVILEYICPALGVIAANVMFSAPYYDLRKAVAKGNLGDLNPTPWAFMTGNCIGWVAYSILLQNLWIFFANCPGFLLSIWLNLGAVKLLYQGHHSELMRESVVNLLVDQERRLSKRFSTASVSAFDAIEEEEEEGEEEGNRTGTGDEIESKDGTINFFNTNSAAEWAKIIADVTSQRSPAPAPHENMVMIIITIWVICISVVCLVPSFTQRTRELIVALLVNVNLMFFYGAPLSTIWTVLREKNSSSIHIRTMVANTLTGLFWSAYGIAVSDLFIAIPNGLGTGLGAIQIILCVLFPRTASGDSLGEDDENRELNERAAGTGIGFPVRLNGSQSSVVDVERNEESLRNERPGHSWSE